MAHMKYYYELTISCSPHVHSPVTTPTIMRGTIGRPRYLGNGGVPATQKGHPKVSFALCRATKMMFFGGCIKVLNSHGVVLCYDILIENVEESKLCNSDLYCLGAII